MSESAGHKTSNRRAYDTGVAAEMGAMIMLRLKGYRILARRYRNTYGEIDLIARRGHLVAFVEVKARRTMDEALNALTARQRARIVAAANGWLAANPAWAARDLRFDVVAMAPRTWPRHITGAFDTSL